MNKAKEVRLRLLSTHMIGLSACVQHEDAAEEEFCRACYQQEIIETELRFGARLTTAQFAALAEVNFKIAADCAKVYPSSIREEFDTCLRLVQQEFTAEQWVQETTEIYAVYNEEAPKFRRNAIASGHGLRAPVTGNA